MNRYLKALPSFAGSKRAIAREITAEITRDLKPGSTVADAFMGSGAVSMACKALGYSVRSNDMSPISQAIGKALIENGEIRLSKEEITAALQTEPAVELPPPEQLSLPDNCRTVLARLATAQGRYEPSSEQHWLIQAWIVKAALTMATWGLPIMRAGRREWDELTAGQAQQLKRTGQPLALCLKLIEQVNNGVFDNGHRHEMRRGDAVEFLAEVPAQTAYLDPPYPGTLAYEEVYVGVNKVLDPSWDEPASEWSAADGWELLAGALDAAENIPTWVVSQGRGADPEAMAQMMSERGREPEWRILKHDHLQALKSVETPEGDELLVIGRKR